MIKQLGIIVSFLVMLPGISGAQNQEPAEQLKALMESCQFSQAITLAELYLSKDSSRVDLLLLEGRALAAMFRYKESIAILRKAQQLDSSSIKVLNELVNVYRLTDVNKAIETSWKITRLVPGNHYFRLQIANLYYAGKDYRKAIEVLLPLYMIDSSDFYLTKQLACCYDEMKRGDSATFFYRRALGITPFDPYITGRLANLLIRNNEVNAAYSLTASFLKKDPGNIPILKQNAYCNYQLLDFEASARQFHRCLWLGDSSKFARKYLGLSYYKQEKYDTAAPFFLSAFLCDTSDAEVCFYYGVSECRSFSVDTGLRYLQRTLALLMPSDQFLSMLYSELAAAYTVSGHADTAIALLKKALETNPGSNIIRFKIAYQYDYYLRKPGSALPWYRDFLKNVPPQPEQDPPGQISESAIIKNGLQEIKITYAEYAKNRISEISRTGKKH